jgi:hypothetical protein
MFRGATKRCSPPTPKPDPTNPERNRSAWTTSRVGAPGTSRLEEATKPFLRENPYSDFGSHLIRVTDAEFEKLRRLVE